MQHFTIILLTLMSFSCDRIKQEDFMAHSDCFVYTDEVKSEPITNGHVEYIDTTKASGCVKEQLKNVYLLYYDTICVAVFNQHPKDNFKLIQNFIQTYQTDTTKLADFVRFDSIIRITISRLCKDHTDTNSFDKYIDWRDIEYSTLTKPFVKTKDDLLTTFHKWTE